MEDVSSIYSSIGSSLNSMAYEPVCDSQYGRCHRQHYNFSRPLDQPALTSCYSIQYTADCANENRLSVDSDMVSVVRTMAQSDSGLHVRNRTWLKIVIPNAFIGSDLVSWLHQHMEGFADRREARKYACSLLKAGYIQHIVNKVAFSEQRYYVFGDLPNGMR